ncbi:MAG: 23S rRNA (pseudouridine(1915)-N(3))-methyltransferase RlmH [Chromatiales bacterium]|jgi:23S rRNA (pseudouridine1915-N3)-methyltransferase|nr:23S rRNA (pseudouridine(1915)-N(3))-methyltransferase RlmH [Chromatiales bacterium]
MRIKLLAVSSRLEDWLREGIESYAARLPREFRLEIEDIPLASRSPGTDPAVALEKEGARLLARLRPREHVVALDERGEQWTSRELAVQLARWREDHGQVALLIGGPEGFDPAVRRRASQAWSLSRLTLPHALVKLLVVEQLYRAVTIQKGHPYHKD